MIEYLYWEGCPSHERALPMLEAMIDDAGIPRGELVITEVTTHEDAVQLAFIGSPTIRIDGVDIADTGDATPGLDCRLYYHRDGRPSPLPDRDDLKEKLESYARERR